MHDAFRESFSQAERKLRDVWMEGSFGTGGLNGSAEGVLQTVGFHAAQRYGEMRYTEDCI